MSRCFPYPPPGFVKIGARVCEVSAGSLKLQKENNKTKTDKRKEKRHKGKKELPTKQTDTHDGRTKKLGLEKSQLDEKMCPSACPASLCDDSSRSGISEEHGQPVPENHFYLSDGTEGSKKRKLDAPSPSTAESGKKIRIRFTLRRKSDAEAPPEQEPVCSTLSRANAEPLAQLRHETIDARVQEPSSAKLEFTTGRKDDIPAKEQEPTIESLYKALVLDWAPAPIFTEEDPHDEDWLGTKQQEKRTSCRLEYETVSGGSRPTGDSWPRAQYLPEAEIFALPYTVPF